MLYCVELAGFCNCHTNTFLCSSNLLIFYSVSVNIFAVRGINLYQVYPFRHRFFPIHHFFSDLLFSRSLLCIFDLLNAFSPFYLVMCLYWSWSLFISSLFERYFVYISEFAYTYSSAGISSFQQNILKF